VHPAYSTKDKKHFSTGFHNNEYKKNARTIKGIPTNSLDFFFGKIWLSLADVCMSYSEFPTLEDP
jgi:hypothetical protein